MISVTICHKSRYLYLYLASLLWTPDSYNSNVSFKTYTGLSWGILKVCMIKSQLMICLQQSWSSSSSSALSVPGTFIHLVTSSKPETQKVALTPSFFLYPKFIILHIKLPLFKSLCVFSLLPGCRPLQQEKLPRYAPPQKPYGDRGKHPGQQMPHLSSADIDVLRGTSSTYRETNS